MYVMHVKKLQLHLHCYLIIVLFNIESRNVFVNHFGTTGNAMLLSESKVSDSKRKENYSFSVSANANAFPLNS